MRRAGPDGRSVAVRGPEELELELLPVAAAFVLDVEHRGGRDTQPLTTYLDGKGPLGFDSVTVNGSSASTAVSPLTLTVIVLLASPARNDTVPVVLPHLDAARAAFA